jgi:ribosome-interacting GTPase 1
MPANLTPAYLAAEQRFRQARTTEEKIAALEEMLRVMPKHKGTDHLQGDIKARLAKLRREPTKKGPRRSLAYLIDREGAGQVALVGPPNTGKSSLVCRFTHARPEVAAYSFTTREPTPGMMAFGDVSFQLVDLPPLSDEHLEPWFFDLLRRADLFWMVLDVSDGAAQLEECEALLAERKIGIYPATGTAPDPPALGWTCRKALVVLTGMDRPEAAEDRAALEELLEGHWPLVFVAPEDPGAAEELGRRTFEALGIVRVYTKHPGKPADLAQPYTLDQGATVNDLAARIHKEIAEKLKFARIWGSGIFAGQAVQRDHVLADGDVVELHF